MATATASAISSWPGRTSPPPGRAAVTRRSASATLLGVGSTIPSTLLGRRRGSGPLTAFGQHLLQHGRTVGHQPVDAQVKQPDHLLSVVDRPYVHLHASPVRLVDEAAIDQRPPG